jgi:hypothetical protein
MRPAMRGTLISILPICPHGVIPKYRGKLQFEMGNIMGIQHSKYFLELLKT